MKIQLVKQTNNMPRMKKAVQNIAKQATMQAGWIQGLKYNDNISIAEVAQIQEFGAPSKNIPPRPFMRPTAVEHQQEWKNTFSKLIQKQDVATVFEKLGLIVSGQIKAKIASIWEPPLKKGTILNRMRRYRTRLDAPEEGRKRGIYAPWKGKVPKSLTKPLIDTGEMLAAVSYEVNKGGK